MLYFLIFVLSYFFVPSVGVNYVLQRPAGGLPEGIGIIGIDEEDLPIYSSSDEAEEGEVNVSIGEVVPQFPFDFQVVFGEDDEDTDDEEEEGIWDEDVMALLNLDVDQLMDLMDDSDSDDGEDYVYESMSEDEEDSED